jgi:hypothetical protein
MFRCSTSIYFVALFIISILFYTHPSFAEDGTKCKCISHPAEAEALGTCSRTEDDKYCTLVFTTTPQEEYDDFKKRLQSFNLMIDPREALKMAYNTPPNEFRDDQLKEILPILFAISQRTHFQNLTPHIAKLFSTNLKEIFGPYKGRGKSVKKINVGNFNAIISYGCIELRQNKIFTMVKTRWSNAEFFCDDFTD